MVFLLKQYPEDANRIDVNQFTSKAYFGYLKFFRNHPELATIKEHKIPQAALSATHDVLMNILIMRVELKLDTTKGLIKKLPQFIVETLRPLKALVLFLKSNNIDDPEIEYFIQKTIRIKLHLQQFDPKQL